jgi:hypothetical protein
VIRSLPLALLALLAACQTSVTTSDGRPSPPEVRPAPPVPAGAQANAMALRVAAKPTDTNGNGYPDLIAAEAYLFSQPHPSPMYEPGAFVFGLYMEGIAFDDGAVPLAEWRIDGDELERRKMRSAMFGIGYGFRLSLLEAGVDELPVMNANLRCSFEPADGRPPVEPTGVPTLQIGRR